jgi:transposase
VTDEWVRRLLRREGLTAQRVRTWKTSSDPAFDRKKNASGRSISAVRRAVVCFDEWGPLELQPLGGVAGARQKRPRCVRATYRRLKGTEQFLGCSEVHADCLGGLFRRRKRLVEISEAFRRLHRGYPRKRLFVILDNLHNVHDHPRFLALLRQLRIRPVGTPTKASWLNRIEAQCGVLKRFTRANTDDLTHAARRRRIYA